MTNCFYVIPGGDTSAAVRANPVHAKNSSGDLKRATRDLSPTANLDSIGKRTVRIEFVRGVDVEMKLDPGTRQVLRILGPHPWRVISIRFSPAGELLVFQDGVQSRVRVESIPTLNEIEKARQAESIAR